MREVSQNTKKMLRRVPLRKSKEPRILSITKKLVKLIFILIVFAIIFFSVIKYKIIPEEYFKLIPSINEKLRQQITSVNAILDSNIGESTNYKTGEDLNKSTSIEAVNDENTSILNYDFEYKYWSLTYASDQTAENINSDSEVNDEDLANTSLSGTPESKGNSIQDKSLSDAKKASPVPKENTKTLTTQSKTSSIKYILPLMAKVSSVFGDRINPIKGTKEYHKGIDFKANMGTAISAFCKGKVIEAGFESTFGNYIIISHEPNLTSLYAHCSKLIVKRGQSVATGELIAYVGSTGFSTGPHLHFEVRRNGTPIDPLKIIN